MRLRDKTVEAADQDRIELKEQVVAGATPGQKLIGGLTAFAAVGVILGGLGYKFWYLPAHGGPVPTALQQQEQKADQAPPKSPTLSVPTGATAATRGFTSRSTTSRNVSSPPDRLAASAAT
ncbi:TPA: hypothetical protein L3M38_003123, partial [Clostridioides difficile]|nr:hypothetical protein [Clostridioides difficile]